MNIDLHDFTILVTRPPLQAQTLCAAIEALGGRAINMPTIDFAPPDDTQAFETAIQQLGEQDWLIFISPQAVYASVPAIRRVWPQLPPHVQFAAVGEGTANALKEAGYMVSEVPEHFSSEGLLDLAAFKNSEGKNIAIIRGEGGRDLLATTLTTRGANISHVIAYKRIMPPIDMRPYLELLTQQKIDVVVTTSVEGLKNFKIMCGEAAWPLIKDVPLIVANERIIIPARELGFTHISAAKNVSVTTILTLIADIKDELCRKKTMK